MAIPLHKLIFYLCIATLVVVQTLDMFLVKNFIGDEYWREPCFIMAWLIKNLGVKYATYLVTIVFYALLVAAIYFVEVRLVRIIVFMGTVMYLAIMVSWLHILCKILYFGFHHLCQ
jgi:hypothetical protein